MLTSDSLVQASLNTPLSLIHLLYSGMGSVAPPPTLSSRCLQTSEQWMLWNHPFT